MKFNYLFDEYVTGENLERKINFDNIFILLFGESIKNESCVYGIYNNSNELLYIGTSQNLRDRIKRHFKAETKIGNYLRFSLLLKRNLKISKLYNYSSFKEENILIKYYNPKFNQNGKS